MVKKIAILTSGGDAPGMNAAIRACINAGIAAGKEMYVIYDGYKGLLNREIEKVDREFSHGIAQKGGTIIYSARLPEFAEPAVQDQAVKILRELGIDALIGIGGDGTYKGLRALANKGIRVVGLPGTIDNDIACTEYTIGFMTCLETICDCIDKINDTTSSHHRCEVIEVMGRYCDDLAIFASVASATDVLICPLNHPTDDEVVEMINKKKANGKKKILVVVAEHLLDIKELAKTIETRTGFETRAMALGHIQRGGEPCAFDRVLAARMSVRAIDILCDESIIDGRIVGIKNNLIVDYEINDALAMKRDHSGLLRVVELLNW